VKCTPKWVELGWHRLNSRQTGMGWDEWGGEGLSRSEQTLPRINTDDRGSERRVLSKETLRRGEGANDPKKGKTAEGDCTTRKPWSGLSRGTRGCAAWDTFGM